MTNKEMDFIGGMNMCDEISNEAYKKIMCHCEELEPCDDCISRKAVKEMLTAEWTKYMPMESDVNLSFVLEKISELPSVTPKTGHWSRKTKVDAYDIAGVKTWGIKCQCDRCDFTTIVVEDFGYYKYCPNCGARMEEI